jgi:outer membrane protein TolC
MMHRDEELPRTFQPRWPRASSPAFGALLFTLVALLAGGCIEQDKEVAIYRNVLDGNHKAPEFDFKPGEPLSLEAALLLTNRSSEQLGIDGETYVQSEIAKEQAFSAFLPTISLAPVMNWSNAKSPIPGTDRRQYSVTTPLNARYNLFNGFQDVANLRSVNYTADQRRALLLDLQQTVLLDTATTYYQVLSAEQTVLVLTNSVSVQEERVRDARGRMTAGLAKQLDVAQSEAQLSSTRAQLISAENTRKTSRQLLAYLTSAPVQESALTDQRQVPNDRWTNEQAVEIAERTRQDAMAAEAAIEAARQNVQAAIGQWYPSVTLDLNYILQHMGPGVALWTSALQANIPIFTAGQIHASVRTAWSKLRSAWLAQQQTRRLIAEQVRVAYENVRDSKRRIAELRVEVAASADALVQAESLYKAGLGTNLDRIAAQDALLSAQLSLTTEEYNYKVFYLNLLRAMGRIPLPTSPVASPDIPATQPSAIEVTTPEPSTIPSAR